MAKQKKSELVPNPNPLEVTGVNLDMIGNKNDPCFGKEYDLSQKECKRCGDSEMCAICFAQYMNITRKELEEKNNFKDMESLIDVPTIKKYMRSLKRKDLEKKEIISKSMSKFEISKKDARKIYRLLKKS